MNTITMYLFTMQSNFHIHDGMFQRYTFFIRNSLKNIVLNFLKVNFIRSAIGKHSTYVQYNTLVCNSRKFHYHFSRQFHINCWIPRLEFNFSRCRFHQYLLVVNASGRQDTRNNLPVSCLVLVNSARYPIESRLYGCKLDEICRSKQSESTNTNISYQYHTNTRHIQPITSIHDKKYINIHTRYRVI